MKRIFQNDQFLLAGSNGMVGNAIYNSLIQNGYGLKENKGIIYRPPKKDLNFFEFDNLKKWFIKYKPTVVIIAAAKVGGIFANNKYPVNYLLENLKIQNNLIECSYQFGVRRLLFLGSSCIYPKKCSQPIKEEYLLNGELEPTNQWYAIAKIAGLKLCEAYRKQYNFDAISLMPTNLYGDGDNYNYENSHVLPALIRKFEEAREKKLSSVTCWGNGDPLREFLHVRDLGEASVFCLESWDPLRKNAPKDDLGNSLNWLNVGSGEEITIKNLALEIAKFTNFKGDIIWDKSKPNGTLRKKLNTTKIRQLGWKPKINLNEGLSLAIEAYRNEKLKNILRI